jgi:acetyl-CoA synthetase
MGDFAWQPSGRYLDRSRVRHFMDVHGIRSWQELIGRSTLDIEWFWNSALEHLGVEWFEKYTRLYDDSRGMPWTTWFSGGKLNIVHNCLDRHIRDGRGAATALWFESDDGSQRSLTYKQLYDCVNRLAGTIKHLGVRKGDRVAMCMPISPEAVIVMLAALKAGAVCVQIPARIAAEDIVFRIQQAQSRLLFVNDGYPRAGKVIRTEGVYEAVLKSASSVEWVVVNERTGNGLAQRPKCLSWDTVMHRSPADGDVETESVESEHPALILYSSGTTGKAKTVVHTHAGALAQVAKEVGYAFDCQGNDVFYWFTNIGWMMAPWEIIGALFFGAAVVLYEGTHLFPTAHRLFEIIEKYGISIFGCTPSVLRELASLKVDSERHDLSTLRILGSTGSVLDAATWEWYFRTFGRERCPIMNISGGTELIGCMLSPLPVMPLKPSTLGGPGLGMAVEVVDSEGKPVRDETGYLVCRKPFPSMTRGFLGDPKLFLETYFPHGPDCWVHGDLARVDEDGYWYLLGRSDDLIVHGGVKHDPAQLEEKLLAFPGPPRIREAVAIGAEDEIKGERIVCFVVLGSDAAKPPEGFSARLKAYIKQTYDPLAQPEEIHMVNDLPVNLSAKIPRSLIRRVYEGKPPGNTAGLANPQAIEEIRRAAEQARSPRNPPVPP